MLSFASLLRESRATVLLALPLVAGQLSQMLMGVADTLMIGRLGVVPLAASTFANTLLYLPLMCGIGMSIAVSIKVSQARGAQEPVAARAALRHGVYVAVALGALTLLAAWLLLPVMPVFRQEPEVLRAVPHYFLLVAGSMAFAMASMAIKSHADAMNRPWPVFWILLGSVLFNVLLNWIFIYGNWGAPQWGLEGAGLATLLARVSGLMVMIWWCKRRPDLREWVPYRWLRRPDWVAVRSLLKTGFPASMQLLAEVSAFVAATLVIGTLSKEALASHQVAISCVATVFMIPLGISMALTVRVGEVWGAKRPERIRPMVMSGWLLATGVSLLSMTAFLSFNDAMAGWFLKEPEARSVAASLLLVAAAFQLSDSLQILSSGALRGLDDVAIPAWIAFGAYWVISLPLGWVLTFPLGLGVSGMWWGITVGLTVTAVALGRRIWRKGGLG
ncbi:MAG: MATE family efflux transporter [Verrucomicrobiota bacterium]